MAVYPNGRVLPIPRGIEDYAIIVYSIFRFSSTPPAFCHWNALECTAEDGNSFWTGEGVTVKKRLISNTKFIKFCWEKNFREGVWAPNHPYPTTTSRAFIASPE